MDFSIKPVSLDNKLDLTPQVNAANQTASFNDTLCKFYSIAPESSLNENNTGSYVLIGTVNGNIGNNENVGKNINLVVDGKIIDHTAETLSKVIGDTKSIVKVNSCDLNTSNSTNIYKIEGHNVTELA